MLVYLIGMSGIGKTTIGKKLAIELKCKFVDLDAEIEKIAQSSIHNVIEQKGEDFFRSLEQQELIKTLKLTNHIIATGGGTPCFFDNMDLMMSSGITIYLEGNPKEIYNRFSQEDKKNRPLLKNGYTGFELLFNNRKQEYQKANYTVNVFEKDCVERMVEVIKCY